MKIKKTDLLKLNESLKRWIKLTESNSEDEIDILEELRALAVDDKDILDNILVNYLDSDKEKDVRRWLRRELGYGYNAIEALNDLFANYFSSDEIEDITEWLMKEYDVESVREDFLDSAREERYID